MGLHILKIMVGFATNLSNNKGHPDDHAVCVMVELGTHSGMQGRLNFGSVSILLFAESQHALIVCLDLLNQERYCWSAW